MFDDAIKFRLSGQMFALIIEHIIVHDNDAIDASMIRDLKQVNALRGSKLASWPSPVERGNDFDRLFAGTGASIKENVWSKIFTSVRRIILFTCGDKGVDDIDQCRCHFGIFELMGLFAAMNGFRAGETDQARQNNGEWKKA